MARMRALPVGLSETRRAAMTSASGHFRDFSSLIGRSLREVQEIARMAQFAGVIALWLGHESVETTQVHLHADMRLKEQALSRVAPPATTPAATDLTTSCSRSSKRSDYAETRMAERRHPRHVRRPCSIYRTLDISCCHAARC